MIRTKILAQRFAAQAAAGLGAIAIAAGVTALGAVGASAAQAAPAVLSSPAPITLNTAHWSGNAGFGASSPAWFKDGFGVVHLEGAAKQINGAGPGVNTIGTLPRAARPSRNVYVIVHTFAGTYADLEVARNGNINVIDPRPPAVTDLSFVSLESVTYRQSGSGATGIALNGSNWSGSAGFGAAGPAADEVGSVVHLQGAVKQISNTGSQQNFIGTLPRADWPARNVFTIVHTFAGTYADLSIGTNGQVRLIDPRSPMGGGDTFDYTFVSLEGVTYHP
jgi:hypothetical protein